MAAVAVLSACGGSGKPTATPTPAASPTVIPTPQATATPHSQPGIPLWEPTGDYRTEQAGIGLTIYSYSIKWDHIGVLYSIDGPAADAVLFPSTVSLADDTGQAYKITSHAILGNVLGVTAGILVAEPYKGEGRTLTLTVSDLTVSSGSGPAGTVSGAWSVTFIEDTEPGEPVAYHQSGRVSPQPVSAQDLTMAVAGPPLSKLLIDREGQQSALYGRIADGGVAEALTRDEFLRLVRVDYPPPPGFPTPEADP